jgi:hypothetical protein
MYVVFVVKPDITVGLGVLRLKSQLPGLPPIANPVASVPHEVKICPPNHVAVPSVAVKFTDVFDPEFNVYHTSFIIPQLSHDGLAIEDSDVAFNVVPLIEVAPGHCTVMVSASIQLLFVGAVGGAVHD